MSPSSTGGQGFSPEFFAHGRLLYRFTGSDACRFSPKLAYDLVRGIAAGATAEPPVLWDPFCGSGLIAGLACLFFAEAFRAIVVSDIADEAVRCAGRNLEMVSNVRAAKKRLGQMRGLQKRNAKSLRRWGDVAQCLEGLLPLIEANQKLARPIHAFAASAFDLPTGIDGEVHFVGDLPYGRSSAVRGGYGVDVLVDRLTTVYPDAKMTLVMTRDDAQRVLSGARGATVETSPCANGRVVLRAQRQVGRPHAVNRLDQS